MAFHACTPQCTATRQTKAEQANRCGKWKIPAGFRHEVFQLSIKALLRDLNSWPWKALRERPTPARRPRTPGPSFPQSQTTESPRCDSRHKGVRWRSESTPFRPAQHDRAANRTRLVQMVRAEEYGELVTTCGFPLPQGPFDTTESRARRWML